MGMKRILLFSVFALLLLVLPGPRQAYAVKIVVLDEPNSTGSASMEVSVFAGEDRDSQPWKESGIRFDKGIGIGLSSSGAEATANSSISTIVQDAFFDLSQPRSPKEAASYVRLFEFSDHQSCASNPVQWQDISAGFSSTLHAWITICWKILPSSEHEYVGMPVTIYFGYPYSIGPICVNSAMELRDDDWTCTIGKTTFRGYETPRGGPLTANALLGDTIRLSARIDIDHHTIDPYSPSMMEDSPDGEAIKIGFFICVSKVPWILIPGWISGPEKWEVFERFLQEDHITFATVDLGSDANPDTRAGTLAQKIDEIRNKRGWLDIKVNLVAHSQGGLDARAYLHDLGDKAKNQVYSLTMIGTPNHGTELADFFDAFRLTSLQPASSRFRQPVVEPFWLAPAWVEDFNQRTPLADDVTYYTIAGSKVLPQSRLIPGENDGVVAVKSVHLDGATPLGPSPDKGTFPYEHNELVTREDVCNTIKRKIDPPYSEEPNSLAFVAIEDGEVLPGQSAYRSIILDDVNEVAFVLISSSPLGFSLESPGGEYIMPQSLNANVSYDSGEWSDLLAQAYVLRHPVPGVWKANVTGGTEPNHFMLVASAEDTFVLDGGTEEYFNPVGEKVRLRASLDTDTSITEMRADITHPNGSREIVVLHDDGLHDDDLPNDGVYGNAFFPSLEGKHTIVFSAKGIVGGREFSRADLESILVEAPGVAEQ
jgi:pimeloyl-ACP methyl ester carboxylesterase